MVTTYLALRYPALSNSPNVPQDIQNLASDVDTKLGGVVICTSSTRPTAREGAVIYETDTNLIRVYDGANWRMWRNTVPMCLLTKSTTTISNNTLTTVTNWTEINDGYGMYPGTGSVITVPYTGQYMVTMTARWASQTTAAGLRSAEIFVNTVEQMTVHVPMTSSFNSTNAIASIAHPMQLTAGDQIEGKVFQSSGGNLDLIGNTRICVEMQREG